MPCWLAGAFAIVQVFIYCLGVRFDDRILCMAWHHLDSELLRHNLFQSLFYLHSQPPLFNLFLGIVLKLSSGYSTLVFHCSFLICSLVIYFSLFYVQFRLGVGRWLAFSLSTLFIVSPSCIAYGNRLYYSFAVAAILTGSALLLQEFLVRQKGWLAFCFFFSLFLVLGTRALFHVSYFIGVAVMLIAFCRPIWRKVALGAAVPFLLIMSIYCKNLLVFGNFATSSWLGMNACNVVASTVSIEDRRKMVAEGKLSELALIDRFSPLDKYPLKYRDVQRYEDIPALTEAVKSDGSTNYNHIAYLRISQQYFEDFLQLLKEHPSAYLKGVVQAYLIYFTPNVAFVAFLMDRDKIAFLENLYDTYFYGKFDIGLGLSDVRPFSLIPGYRIHLFLLLGLPLLLGYGLMLSLRTRAKSRPLDREQRILVLYLCFNIIYVAVVGNMLELGENSRFRFLTDPFYIVLLGLFIQFFVRTRLSRVLRKLRSSKLPTQNPGQ